MTYSDKLKLPKWQKKRLEILERDKFTCQICLNEENTLHVHHIAYVFSKSPWDYPDNVFITLCDKCHSLVHGADPIQITDNGELSVYNYLHYAPISLLLFSKIENNNGSWVIDFPKDSKFINNILGVSTLIGFIGKTDNSLHLVNYENINLTDYAKPFISEIGINLDLP